jgi:23S rRNA pseudouridine2605 synthase
MFVLHSYIMRLNAYLAGQLGMSRRQADELIQKGFIEIDGEIATFTDSVGASSTLRVYRNHSWETVRTTVSAMQTILVYKPIFTVTTSKDPQGRKTIYDILPKKYKNLKYAGRLDYLSEGLMVFSNSGELIHELSHPSMGKTKVYLVSLKYPLRMEQIREIEEGLEISGEAKFEALAISKATSLGADITEKLPGYDTRNMDYLKFHNEHFVYAFTLNEGQNNQIRKICKHFGQDVMKLVRTEMGKYKISYDLHNKKIIEL